MAEVAGFPGPRAERAVAGGTAPKRLDPSQPGSPWVPPRTTGCDEAAAGVGGPARPGTTRPRATPLRAAPNSLSCKGNSIKKERDAAEQAF
ncbi:hypothetical protein GCM10018773_30760 [Streptomyces candidus]|nr:hypothetical protein GCM10018773_30760 [Streptomyces candidus]